jgi:hypothetical protein
MGPFCWKGSGIVEETAVGVADAIAAGDTVLSTTGVVESISESTGVATIEGVPEGVPAGVEARLSEGEGLDVTSTGRSII